jgi:hypothetical protein
VLWVVPSARRLERLARWIEEEATSLGASAAIFAITVRELLDERRILTHPIWQVVSSPSPRSLLPTASTVEAAADPWRLVSDEEPATR